MAAMCKCCGCPLLLFMADKNSYTVIIEELKKYARLKLDYAKLTGAEKLSVLLSSLAVAGCIAVIFFIVLFFIAAAFQSFISQFVGNVFAHLVVAALFVVLGVVLYLCRKTLILNPICRIVSKVLIDK